MEMVLGNVLKQKGTDQAQWATKTITDKVATVCFIKIFADCEV